MVSLVPGSVPLRLVVHRGDLVDRVVELTGAGLTVGRGPENELVLDDQKISRLHARFECLKGRWWVEDRQSANRTFVNGLPVDRASLEPGDQVELGPFRLVLEACVQAAVEEGPTEVAARGRPLSSPMPQARELELILSIVGALDVETPGQEILGRLLGSLLKALDGERAFLFRFDSRRGTVQRVLTHLGVGADSTAPVSESLALEVARDRTPRLLGALDKAHAGEGPSLMRLAEGQVRSVVVSPLMAGRRLAGVLYVDSRNGRRHFSTGDLDLLARTCGYLAGVVAHLEQRDALAKENRRLRAIAEGGGPREVPLDRLHAAGSPYAAALDLLIKGAGTDVSMLLIGETGTGKEEAARAIHRRSARGEGPFVAINCGGIPESLLEAELFGYRKGAFTGATDDRAGLVEMAHRGTLFLDEVGELPPAAQVKLLRVLEERKVQRLGAGEAVSVDFRLVAATHRDLGAHVVAGTFRQDLLFRIRVLEVSLPPLRERRMDLPLLVEYLVEVLAARAGVPVRGATAGVMELLATYAWPGNIRELRNVLERALVLEETDQLTPASLPDEFRRCVATPMSQTPRSAQALAAEAETGAAQMKKASKPPGGAPTDVALRSYAQELAEFERDYVGRLRQRAGDNISRMARLSGISRFTLYRKLGEIGLATRSGAPDDE